MENLRKVGADKEDLAVEFLKGQGYQIITRNYRCRLGEVDIIAYDHQYLCFVEVKYRTSRQNGRPEEAVDRRKQRKITKVAQFYLMMEQITPDRDIRFDVVSIESDEIVLFQNAFEAIIT